MKEIYLSLMTQLNSSVFILALAFILVYKIGSWAEKFFNEKEFEEKKKSC